MQVTRRKAGAVTVLECAGDLVVDEGPEALRSIFRQALREGERALLLDLSRVDRIDSIGLGEVVACWKRAREAGGRVRFVVAPGERPARLLAVTGLDRIFERFSDAESALTGF